MTWETFVTLRVGPLRSKELNATPALGVALVCLTLFLLLKTGGL